MKKTGIYKIVNLITEKVYVGSAVNINGRWGIHIRLLNKKKHHSPKLQNSVNKHGFNNFLFEIIEECQKELLIEREQYWINFFDSFNNGYNSTPKAGSKLGFKFSEESKKKMSTTRIGNKNCVGRNYSEKTLKKMSETKKGKVPWNKGIPRTDEEKKKISESKKGKKMSEETKNKMSESRKGEKNPNYGSKKSKII